MALFGLRGRSARRGLGSVLVLAGAGALALAACGGDDATSSPPTVNPGVEGGVGGDGQAPGSDAQVPPPPGPGVMCGDASIKGGAGSQTLTVAGTKRTYELFIPATYDHTKTFPVIFVFHGDGGTGANIRSAFKLEDQAAGGAIFVYPDGLNQTWVIDDAKGLAADIAFIDAIAANLTKTLCTNTKVFSVGFSKGAYFSNMLACLSKTKLRAVVAHSGGGPFGLDNSGTSFDGMGNLICPSAPIAAMQIIGGADDLLGDAKQARDYWTRLDTCKSTTQPFAPSPCVSYDGCAADRPEVYCEIPGMGHQIWANAPQAVWGFLKTK